MRSLYQPFLERRYIRQCRVPLPLKAQKRKAGDLEEESEPESSFSDLMGGNQETLMAQLQTIETKLNNWNSELWRESDMPKIVFMTRIKRDISTSKQELRAEREKIQQKVQQNSQEITKAQAKHTDLEQKQEELNQQLELANQKTEALESQTTVSNL